MLLVSIVANAQGYVLVVDIDSFERGYREIKVELSVSLPLFSETRHREVLAESRSCSLPSATKRMIHDDVSRKIGNSDALLSRDGNSSPSMARHEVSS